MNSITTSLFGQFQRVPNTPDAEVLKILPVGGGKFRDPVMAQGEGHPNIEHSAAWKIRCRRKLPQLILRPLLASDLP
jgi:hypothetical protein